MRTSLLKAVVFSITALVLGGALATTPAIAAAGHGGGGFGGSFPSGDSHGFGGAPSFHGPVSHGGSFPSGGFAPGGGAVPHGGLPQSWGATHHRHYTPGRRYPRGFGGIVIAPEMCDDYYCDEEYYYEDSDCWIYRRVYNRHGKFLGWRQVYICQEGQ